MCYLPHLSTEVQAGIYYSLLHKSNILMEAPLYYIPISHASEYV